MKVQLEEEKRREKEIEQIIDSEIEKQFQKRLAQWKAEKEARRRLLEDVLRERKQQVEDKSKFGVGNVLFFNDYHFFKVRRNEDRQKELEKEKIELNHRIEYYRELERVEQQNVSNKNKFFQNDLVAQIDYNAVQKQRVKIIYLYS